ncbi:hypothetical protein [Luteolibacter sp. Populi]|uniref:hypothetical protein n=1 Tax=Luteolibacter sp. Populi TaxID=3230487 RepID=UPI0034679D20
MKKYRMAVIFLLLIACLVWWKAQFAGKAAKYDPIHEVKGGYEKSSGATKLDDSERRRRKEYDEKIDRRSEAATEEARRIMAASTANFVPVVIPLNSAGELTNSAIDMLRISKSEAELLGSKIKEIKTEQAEDFVSRAKLIPSKESGDAISKRYYVRAKVDRGVASKDRLAKEVEEVLGKDRSERFMGGVDDLFFYGGFGKYDIELKFYSDDNGEEFVNCNYISPAGGGVAARSNVPLASPDGKYWDVFDK